MPTLVVLVALVITLASVAAGIAARRIVSAWLRFHRRFIVTCPTDRSHAGVVVDAGHAALTACKGNPRLRLSGCSHWPERESCARMCLAQLVGRTRELRSPQYPR